MRAREKRGNFSEESGSRKEATQATQVRNSERSREKELVKKGGELVRNSDREIEKGNKKTGEEVTQVTQSKKKKVSNFKFTVNYLKILLL